MKVVEKIMKLNKRKLFTKKQKNNIINEAYNPLKVNLIYMERDDLFMIEIENEVLSEIMKETNFIKKIMFRSLKKDFIKVYKKGIKKGFNWCNNNVT